MEFGILGPLTATDGGRPVHIPGAKPRALLAILVLHAGQAVSGSLLVDHLWAAGDLPADPVNALQRLVSRLRKEIGAERLSLGPSGYLLDLEESSVDAVRFERLAADGHAAVTQGRHEAAAVQLREALDLWRGPALADFEGEPFAQAESRRLDELRLGAAEDCVEARLELGQHRELVGELEVLVAEHPLRERARGQLMRALYRGGRQAEALTVYQEARSALADTLGLDPGPELQRLQLAVLSQDSALDPPAAPRTNLRVPLTSLVGRDTDIEQVVELLAETRLVTLTGAGGAGKTRLGLAVGTQVATEMPDGVWVVELAPLRDPATVAQAVLSALGTRTGPRLPGPGVVPAGDPLERVVELLRRKRVLLLLDNCEHLVDTVAKLVDTVLGACPGVRILATSREALAVNGEARWPVPALRVTDATRLFTERARAAHPGFTADGEADTVAEICRRLDGLPLAIELAAARVPALSLRGIADRLHDRFRLLTAGSRAALPRQRTLRAVVDWSWDLLDGTERTVLRRLSVFAGGATLEAAGQVCADGGDVLDIVGRLVDKSLATPDTGTDGELRYRMLETVRAYAAERLSASGEGERVGRAHSEYYMKLAETAEPEFRGPRQLQVIRLLDTERDNLRAALRWAVEAGDDDIALRVSGAMAWFWWVRGTRAEATTALEAALAIAGEQRTRHRARAWLFRALLDVKGGSELASWTARIEEAHEIFVELGETVDAVFAGVWRASLKLYAGEREEGSRLLDEAIASSRRTGDEWVFANGVLMRCGFAFYSGDLDAAERDAADCAARFRALGDRWSMGWALHLLASIAEIRGDYDRAVALISESLALTREFGNREFIPHNLTQLGILSTLRREHQRAASYQSRALGAATDIASGQAVAHVRFGIGLGARYRDDDVEARAELERALAWHRAEGMHFGAAPVLAHLGFVLERQGELDGAEALHREGLELVTPLGDPRAVALGIEGLAGVAAARGRHAQAARMLGWAEHARAGAGAPMPDAERLDVDRLAAAARRALGDSRFTEALASGATTTLAELLDPPVLTDGQREEHDEDAADPGQ